MKITLGRNRPEGRIRVKLRSMTLRFSLINIILIINCSSFLVFLFYPYLLLRKTPFELFYILLCDNFIRFVEKSFHQFFWLFVILYQMNTSRFNCKWLLWMWHMLLEPRKRFLLDQSYSKLQIVSH